MDAFTSLAAFLGLTYLIGLSVGLGIFSAARIITPVKRIQYDNLDKYNV